VEEKARQAEEAKRKAEEEAAATVQEAGTEAFWQVNPPETSRSYSSTYRNAKPGVNLCQSMLDSKSAWVAGKKTADQWMQIDLGKVTAVAGVVTQGRVGGNQFVTEFSVEISFDGVSFTGIPNWTSGNTDGTTHVTKLFDGWLVRTRYVRLLPTAFRGHPSMRAAVIKANKPDMPSEDEMNDITLDIQVLMKKANIPNKKTATECLCEAPAEYQPSKKIDVNHSVTCGYLAHLACAESEEEDILTAAEKKSIIRLRAICCEVENANATVLGGEEKEGLASGNARTAAAIAGVLLLLSCFCFCWYLGGDKDPAAADGRGKGKSKKDVKKDVKKDAKKDNPAAKEDAKADNPAAKEDAKEDNPAAKVEWSEIVQALSDQAAANSNTRDTVADGIARYTPENIKSMWEALTEEQLKRSECLVGHLTSRKAVLEILKGGIGLKASTQPDGREGLAVLNQDIADLGWQQYGRHPWRESIGKSWGQAASELLEGGAQQEKLEVLLVVKMQNEVMEANGSNVKGCKATTLIPEGDLFPMGKSNYLPIARILRVLDLVPAAE